MFNETIDLTSFVGQVVDPITWANLVATSLVRHGPTWTWLATPLDDGCVYVAGMRVTHSQNAPEGQGATLQNLPVG